MAKQEKYLYMISQKYPYGKGEVYLARELKAFSAHYDKIILMPLDNLGQPDHRSLPENVELSDFMLKRPKNVQKKYFLTHFWSILSILWQELRNTTGGKKYLRSNLKEFAGQLIMGFDVAQQFEKRFLSVLDSARASGGQSPELNQQSPERSRRATFYSVWMDEGAVMFALLKRQNKIPSFSIRLHGYDLYDDRREGNYMPFRQLCFKHAKNIFIVSQAGYDYLAERNLFTGKLKVNYSGIYDHGMNPLPGPNDPITLLSVSNMVPIKRIDLIMEILAEMEVPIKWIHIGDGTERQKLEGIRSTLPPNIEAVWTGAIPFEEILELYKTTPIHAFIHLSETEGLPMAVVEAQSFGIPAIATDAGGTKEILQNETVGWLLPVKVDREAVKNAILVLPTSAWNNAERRQQIKQVWAGRFDADKNYATFVKQLEG